MLWLPLGRADPQEQMHFLNQALAVAVQKALVTGTTEAFG
jgi:hypothetical protein